MIGDQQLTISISNAEQLLDLYNKSNKKNKKQISTKPKEQKNMQI